jgi:hypothetical protein
MQSLSTKPQTRQQKIKRPKYRKNNHLSFDSDLNNITPKQHITPVSQPANMGTGDNLMANNVYNNLNIPSSRGGTQRNHYQITNQPAQTQNLQNLDLSGQISSIRYVSQNTHHPQFSGNFNTLDSELLNLNNLEKRLEIERAKFLSIIKEKDLMIQQLQEELDQSKDREIKYKMMLVE